MGRVIAPRPVSAGTLSSVVLFGMVFAEGFASLGAEIVALRRLVPHLGSAITVTAPTIGFFLLALALGYQTGGRVARDYLPRVRRNFLLAAALIAVGLAGPVVDALFAGLDPLPAYLIFIAGVLGPIAWLLGQTVPVLTNLLRHERAGARSGAALYWSTLGSFLGSVSLSLVVMQWLGVSAAILICAALLLALVPFLGEPAGRLQARELPLPALISAAALGCNVLLPQQIETAYATYRVEAATLPGTTDLRVFRSNNSVASLIDASEPPHYARYIERLRTRLLDDLGFRGRHVLVLGGGGFTLSHREPLNDYLYVDIDPAIRDIAEREFLREPVRGRFLATDARRFVAETDARFDAVVVDVYSAHTSIPAHLVTREFWLSTRRALAPGGVLLANLILDPRLETPYARTLLATIQSVYGQCSIEVLFHDRPLGNVLVQCFAGLPPAPVAPYTDERNRADLDLLTGG